MYAALLCMAVLLITAGVALAIPRMRTSRLRTRFGSEYDRELARNGGAVSRTEDELEQRLARHRRLPITAPGPAERELALDEFRGLQVLFVADPPRAVEEMHQLVTDLVDRAGYPREQREEALSVDFARQLAAYRSALATVERTRARQVTTEELRGALLGLRGLGLAVVLHEPARGPRETTVRGRPGRPWSTRGPVTTGGRARRA
ncbi:hypothetical protein OG500_03165 [Kitasatospora sp. NBC_01250]|uniref:hypothetical protein n=1 Tax=unclassified Kitasatospora TaxID=2633591 RepID=UPI002E0E4E55|nr:MULTISPECIES: hypothetical protein [unclassified Kitasatospora]WSJ65169.1 hypothetical protein OG294_03130 [Kitasatospora sp. NBC_01302]